MLRRNYNLILMAIWLFIGICLIAPEWVVPANARKHFRDPAGGIVGVLAFAFAAYNLARWWAFRTTYRNRYEAHQVNPLARRHAREETPPYEANPDLDFLKPPSANGDHKG